MPLLMIFLWRFKVLFVKDKKVIFLTLSKNNRFLWKTGPITNDIPIFSNSRAARKVTSGSDLVSLGYISILLFFMSIKAYLMELIICFPKDAFSPESGANTPILIFVSSEYEMDVSNNKTKNIVKRILKKLFI